jgi:membrane-bound lytic murein transglycosylase D
LRFLPEEHLTFDFFRTFKTTPNLFLLVVSASLLISIGCAQGRKNIPTLGHPKTTITTKNKVIVPAPAKPAEALSLPDSLDVSDTLASLGEEKIFQDPADLIEEAKSYCSQRNYASADSTLKEAVKAAQAMEDGPIDSASDWFPSSQYIDDIVALYNQKMPASYPVPEELLLGVFQRQMMRSLDSMNALPTDSMSLAAIVCQKNISYDIPMVWNQRVQRSVYMFLKNRKNSVDNWFPRASKYLPAMKKMFADSGLPQDLAYLPLIESGFNPLAYSFAHASGIWQFIASTGKLYGLSRSFWVDERRDPLKATVAAIRYLKKLYGDFNNWHLALAAYNCGENGIARCIARDRSSDFWSLKKLPKETKNYVPFYLAALTIAKNPKCFGVAVSFADTFFMDTVRLNDCISMADIGAGLGVEYDTLRKMNPHIMRWCTPPDVTNTLLYLPKGKLQAWRSFYAQVPPEKRVRWNRYEIKRNETIESISRQYNVPPEALININRIAGKIIPGHHLFIPTSETPLGADVAYSLPPESEIKALDLPDYEFSGAVVRHRIRSGDNLGKIARHYHVSINQLCRWNRVTGRTLLRPGRVLVVSRPQPQIQTATTLPSALTSPATATPTPTTALQGATVATPSATMVKPAVRHIVLIGETLFSISRKYNLTVQELASLNGLDIDHPSIRIGQTLMISNGVPAQTVRLDTVSLAMSSANYAKHSNDLVFDSTDNSPFSGSRSQEQEETPMVGEIHRHVVVAGENLFRISRKYSVSMVSLLTANHISDLSVVRAGDTLIIPAQAETPVSPAPQPDCIYYKIKEGDTLLRIAAAFGVPVKSIYEENNLTADTVLTPGNIIKVINR